MEIFTACKLFYNKLGPLNSIKIPRRIISDNPVEISLCGFCDASERAYGACLYLKSVDEAGNILVRLLSARSRVAPLKKISLPRLELCSAVLLTRLAKTVIKAYKYRLVTSHIGATLLLRWLDYLGNQALGKFL